MGGILNEASVTSPFSLFSPHRVARPWEAEQNERGRKRQNQEVKGYKFPIQKQTNPWNTTLHYINTAHICSHRMLRWQKQQPTIHNKQDRMTTTEQLFFTGQRHCGVFWAHLLAVTDDHHKLFINLTSQQWRGRSCEATLLCHQAWALQERKREKLVPRVWERWVCSQEKEGVL